ncbi:hypothetical protein NQF87_08450 [Bombella sp. TMW 2.2559]|uniref:Arc family DNA-binding protein n=1 Tax=Bombella dulcis TaxID=2967339 RepID=A0ABT3WDG8_9PROT|nr:hypothetical protein [Bombella dulcis]MCX5616996.1 hypothetical protein [Bombella dulcis]
MTTCALHIRIPAQIKRWLAGEAKRNERSINAQTVFVLRQEMDKEKALGPIAKQTPNASEQ